MSYLELEKNNHFTNSSPKGKLRVRVEEDGQPPKVKLTFGSSTAFMGEVEKIKGKEITQGVSHWQTGQEGHGKEATAQNCSLGK